MDAADSGEVKTLSRENEKKSVKFCGNWFKTVSFATIFSEATEGDAINPPIFLVH